MNRPGVVRETTGARGKLRDEADANAGWVVGGGAMQDVAQMTHHRAEGRHGLRGAEDASAALAELCRTGERGASAKVGATQQYGFTGSRLPRLCGESSSALRLVLVATGL